MPRVSKLPRLNPFVPPSPLPAQPGLVAAGWLLPCAPRPRICHTRGFQGWGWRGSGIPGVSAGGETSHIPQLSGCTGWKRHSGADDGTGPTLAGPAALLRCGGRATAGPGDKRLPGPDSRPGSIPAQGLAILPPANLEPGQDGAPPGSHPAERVETPVMTWCRSRRRVIDSAACNSPVRGLTAHVMAIRAPFVLRSWHPLPPRIPPCARCCLSSPFPPVPPPWMSWSHGRVLVLSPVILTHGTHREEGCPPSLLGVHWKMLQCGGSGSCPRQMGSPGHGLGVKGGPPGPGTERASR